MNSETLEWLAGRYRGVAIWNRPIAAFYRRDSFDINVQGQLEVTPSFTLSRRSIWVYFSFHSRTSFQKLLLNRLKAFAVSLRYQFSDSQRVGTVKMCPNLSGFFLNTIQFTLRGWKGVKRVFAGSSISRNFDEISIEFLFIKFTLIKNNLILT